MDKEAAKKILTETFDAPFDESRFNLFALNLLNDIDTSKAFPFLSENNIHQSFKNHISKYRRLGSYTDSKGETIDILVVHLKNEWALERSRTMLRNFTANYLEDRGRKDSALVAYYTDNPEDWRFSYIRMDYKQELTESGKIKVKKELTPARRYSFLVGENEPNHTAQAQLLDILKEDTSNPTLSDLENAFSVDAVSKQFYLDYRYLYEKLEKELNEILKLDQKIAQVFESQTIDTANFAKKLLGQIVFLYFIQKKGWLGVGKDKNGNFKQWGSGPKNFLHLLFNKDLCDYKNFFNDILEPLFYEALACEHDDDYYSPLDCKIPFLNGGLFEPLNEYNWRETDIQIDNDILADVFTTLNQYNFTVKEDEPLEKEVAIDPEMLGKVFENLLPENLRKGKGAYYTPRPIVHYMCQESLINYLYSEVNNETISYQDLDENQLDALGNSPTKNQLGIQTEHKREIVSLDDIETFVREGETILELEAVAIGESNPKSVILESVKNNANKLDEALSTIKVCDPAIGSGAFAVGMLNEIVKARKILQLYLGEDTKTYSLKRHCIQESIYGVDIDSGAVDISKLRLWLSLVVDENDYNHIDTLPNLDYKIMQGNSLIKEFHGISLEIKMKQEDLFSGGSSLDTLIDDLHNKQADFFNAEHPKEKKKKREAVETAIFNIFLHELEKKKNISSQEAKEIEIDLKEMTHGNKKRNFFPWKLYFADVFHANDGFDVVIANPPYINISNIEDKNYRNYLKKNFQVAKNKSDLYSFFVEKGNSILRNGGELIFIISNSWLGTESFTNFRKFLVDNTKVVSLTKCPPNIFENATVTVVIIELKKDIVRNTQIKLNEYKNKSIEMLNHSINYDDIRNQMGWSFTFEKIININIDTKMLGDLAKFSLGIKTSNDKRFIKDSPSDKDFYKVLRGKNINRWLIKFDNNWIWYRPKLMKEKVGAGPRKLQDFHKEKILIKDIASKIEATIDYENYLTLDTISIMFDLNAEYDYKYILSLLNSKFVNYWFKTNFPAGLHIKLNQIKRIPIPIVNQNNQRKLIGTVDNILSSKKANPQVDTTTLEAEIDQLVYKLYDLSGHEISIVEENVGV